MIWLTLSLFVVSFFLSYLLTPSPDAENVRAGTLDDLNFPQADEGSPVALLFGRCKLKSPHVLWYGDFTSSAVRKKVKTGLFSSKRVTTGYKYYVGLHLGLAIGPNVRIRKIQLGKYTLWSGTASGDGSLLQVNKSGLFGGSDRGGGFVGDIRFYSGGDSQSENVYLEGQLGTVPAYNNVAHLVFEKPYIGTAPSLRIASVELERYPNNLALASGVQLINDDLNPAEILYDILTDNWGGLNIDPYDIDTASFLSVAITLADEENGMSILVTKANNGKKVIEEVLRQIDGILYQDPVTGKMVLRLIRDDYDEATIPLLDETRIAEISNFSRTAWSDTLNQVRTVFTDRRRDYEKGSAFIQDMSNIAVQDQVRSTTISFPGCMEPALANRLGARELSQLGVPLVRATLRLKRIDTVDLRPGDVFRMNWDDYGIEGMVMRVQKFNMGELTDGRVVLEVLQDSFADASPIYANPADTSWAVLDRPATDITEFTVFESPKFFVDQALDIDGSDSPVTTHLWALARPPAYGEGYDLITSNDSFVGEITTDLSHVEFPNSATLVEGIYQQMGQPTGELTKIVIGNLYPDDFEPSSSSESDIQTHGYNLIMINGEFMAFEGVTDNGDGTFDLEDVHRALLDSPIEDHAIGDAVYFIDSIDWLSFNSRDYPGTYGYKLLCFTDQDSQDENDVSQSNIVFAERYKRPYAPDYITVDGERAPFAIIGVTDVDVTFRARNRQTDTIVFYDDTAETPEGSITYNAYFKMGGTAISNNLGAAGPTINLSGLSGAGWARVELDSVLDSDPSHEADAIEFFYANYVSLTSELVTDGDFELSGVTNWTNVSGTFAKSATSDYHPLYPEGDQYLHATADGSEVYQDITVSSYQGQAGIFRIFHGSESSGDESSVVIEQRDGGGLLDSITVPASSVDPGKWEVIDVAIPIRSDCATLRIRLLGDTGAAFEECSFKVNTVTRTTAMTDYDSVTGVTVQSAYGLRTMVSTYSGPLIKIRDTDDDTETDLYADIDGNLEAFYTVGEARVVKLYDQSGSAAHLEPSLVARQPRLRHQLSPTGRCHIEFNETLKTMLSDPTTGTSRPYMDARPNAILLAGPRTASSSDGWLVTIWHDTDTADPYYRWGLITKEPEAWEVSVNGTKRSITGDPTTGNHVWILDYQNGDAYQNAYTTPVDSWTATDITYPEDTLLVIGQGGGGLFNWEGDFYELCIYTGNIAQAERNSMMNQATDYWWNTTISS